MLDGTGMQLITGSRVIQVRYSCLIAMTDLFPVHDHCLIADA